MDDARFDVLLFGLIEAEYLLGLDAAPVAGEARVIEAEVRRAGGSALRCARVLALWGARVCLMGNPLADDSNGRLIVRELNEMPDVAHCASHAASLPAGYETPYSVICLARDEGRTVLTRHGCAQKFDRSSFATGSETSGESGAQSDSPRDSACASHACASHMSTHAWPQARLAAICGDHLARASLDLARTMNRRDVPLFALDAVLDATSETALRSAPNIFPNGFDEASTGFSQWLGDLPRGEKNTVVVNRNEAKIWWQPSGGELQNLTLPQTAQNANVDLLAREGSESVFLAGLLWARLREWEWRRSLGFAAAAFSLALNAPGATPSLGQIEAVS